MLEKIETKKGSRDHNKKEGNKKPVRNGYYPPASIKQCQLNHMQPNASVQIQHIYKIQSLPWLVCWLIIIISAKVVVKILQICQKTLYLYKCVQLHMVELTVANAGWWIIAISNWILVVHTLVYDHLIVHIIVHASLQFNQTKTRQ